MASSSATSLFKPTSMANSCLTSHPTLFITKASYPFLSLPLKPIKHIHFSSSTPSLHLMKKSSSSSIIPFVASGQVEVEEEETETTISDSEGEIEGLVEEESADEGSGDDSYEEPSEDAKLFVGNLPYDIDSEKLAELFDQAGEVQISEVIYNRDTDTSRGFAFVTMSNVEEAEKAIEMFNRYEINNRPLTVNKASPKGSRPERSAGTFNTSLRVYAGNLPWSMDNARLEQIFSEHGKVLDARVVYDRESGRSRGFGFVTMENETEMNDAIAALDGQSMDGRALRVNVAEERARRQF